MTWQQAQTERARAESLARAWERMARVSAAISRELMASDCVSSRTLLRRDLAVARLRVLGARVEGL